MKNNCSLKNDLLVIITRRYVSAPGFGIGTEIVIRTGIVIGRRREAGTETRYAPHSDHHAILTNRPAARVAAVSRRRRVSVKLMEVSVSIKVEEILSAVQIDVAMMGSAHVSPKENPASWVMISVVED